ncbi:MAG: hypothetical protein Q8933_21735 [Bacteroidota bacterium]|nr:hypothetical protein [Bacteroidota bacterium]
MADVNLVKLAVDAHKGKIAGNYSKDDSMEVLRNALIEMNGGSTKLDYKRMRNGDCNEMFAIVEEILQKTIVEGIQDDNFFAQFVDYRNIALGDERDFYIPDNSIFVVADTAEGTQAVRRQRLNAGTSTSVGTSLKTIKIYEELNRILAGRVDFNDMIDKVGESFKRKIAVDIYNGFVGAFSALPSPFTVNGAFAEQSMLDLIEHVEAATGQSAMIVGTRNALRKVTSAVVSENAKETYNELGYYGSFNGTPMMKIKQAHTPGTYNFMITDTDLFVVPAGIKPVKFVTEGDSLIIPGNPLNNADLTQDYLYGDRYGLAVLLSVLFGIYRTA